MHPAPSSSGQSGPCVLRHGEQRGAHLQGGALSLGPAGGLRTELHLATRRIPGPLQLHPQRHMGLRARAHVAHHPHHSGGVLRGVRGGLGGQLSGDVCHHQVSVSFSSSEARESVRIQFLIAGWICCRGCVELRIT